MRRDVATVEEPYWRVQYRLLVEQYKLVEQRLQERLNDLTEMQERVDTLEGLREYYAKREEDMRIDYMQRLNALGMSDKDIKEFNEHWKNLTERI